jgi:hypothetical protein
MAGANFPSLNCVCEVLDNCVRACLQRSLHDGGTGSVWLRVYSEGGAWCLSIRDNGVGLSKELIPNWATLGVRDGTPRPAADEDPTAADGNLHWWGVGGKVRSTAACIGVRRRRRQGQRTLAGPPACWCTTC